MNKFKLDDYLNNDCSKEQYYSQFKQTKLEVGKIYKQGLNTWFEKHYKIIFQDDNISLAITVYNKISSKFIGDYDLFITNSGFKYNDIRIEEYQLIE